jgi:hypothetical protein
LVGNTGTNRQGNHLHIGYNVGDKNGNMDYKNNWINPEKINIGKYKYIEDTPYYKQNNNK